MTEMVAGISKASIEREAAMMEASSNFIWARKIRALRAALDKAEAERDRHRVALERIAKCTRVSPSGEDRTSYEAQIALDALGPKTHAIEAARAALKGESHE